MDIVMVASEAAPFAKSGGLADVLAALPAALVEAGHRVAVVLPLYGHIDPRAFGLTAGREVLVVPMGTLGNRYGRLWRGHFPGTPVEAWLVEHAGYFDRPGRLYDHQGVPYADNGERFLFLSRAALEACRLLGRRPDIIHAHDWHAAACLAQLRELYGADPLLAGAAGVLTLHNLQHQGVFAPDLFAATGLPECNFDWRGFEQYGRLNLLKGGVAAADAVTTVSPTYAAEILAPACGFGLEGALAEARGRLTGIRNGVDYAAWPPASQEERRAARAAVGAAFGLAPGRPRFTLHARLCAQKGVAELLAVVPWLLSQGASLVLHGAGDPALEEAARRLASRHPGLVGFRSEFGHPSARQVLAGSDFVLLPSRFEPCGLVQLYAMAVGTPPLVTPVGGLKDTVRDFTGTVGEGFVLEGLGTTAFRAGLARALALYRQPKLYRRLAANAAAARFTWGAAAADYLQVYRAAQAARRQQR